jgi:hypothetical protein
MIGLHLFLDSFNFFLTSRNIGSRILVAGLYRGLHPLLDGVRDGGHLDFHNLVVGVHLGFRPFLIDLHLS